MKNLSGTTMRLPLNNYSPDILGPPGKRDDSISSRL